LSITIPDGDPPSDNILAVTIEEEMSRSYLDYAMSVIVARALPDVRDGLKPVQRRILYSMHESGFHYNRTYRKSARIVGDVMGKYHPHGDSAIYDAMVRMAQDFSLRLPLVDGQGNFGSMDGDPPAAMRYTEARLARAAHSLLDDIDRDTVEFRENYDETTSEPTVLPSRIPNLLVNGAGGIAVGMATSIPPHNLGEIVDACCALLADERLSDDALLAIVPGPDFPTGGIIQGTGIIRQAYTIGRGTLVVRGRTRMEDRQGGRVSIIVSEVPYQVNKSRMVERIAEAVNAKIIEGVSDLRDESDRDGVRVVIELKRDAEPEVVLNQLYRYSPLQSSFGVNMVALNGGRPEIMSLRDVLQAFIAFREEVITRRTRYELSKARERAHTLMGLAVAVANLDEVIRLIRAARDPEVARQALTTNAWPAIDIAPLIALVAEPDRRVVDDQYSLSNAQARAILELRLHRLTGLEREKIAGELQEVVDRIADYLEILASRERLRSILREELVAIKNAFATPRRTELAEGEALHDLEDLIQREDMVVTVTHNGYIKRVPLSTYRSQRRGGKGRMGMTTTEDDVVAQVFVVNTHTPVLFFSSRGMVYMLKVYRLPLGSPQTRGKALINLLPLEEGETITTLMPLPEDEAAWSDSHILFATASGNVRRNRLDDFTNVMANGKIAMKLNAGDRLIGVAACQPDSDVLLAARSGRCTRFSVDDVRVFSGRTSTGVRGFRLAKNDEVISLSVLDHVAVDTETREAYLRAATAARRLASQGGEAEADDRDAAALMAEAPYDTMAVQEQFILSITENGYGKRSSAYEYRTAKRGGKGYVNIVTSERNGPAVASFAVGESDQIMLVSDRGRIMRCPVNDIRIAGRATQGVTVFDLDDGERTVSVSQMTEDEEGGEGDTGGAAESAGNGVDHPAALEDAPDEAGDEVADKAPDEAEDGDD